jgi:membrane protein implicated in regulation of membrane protease activity
VTTYLAIGIAGLALLALSLLVGDLFDGMLGGLGDALSSDWFSSAVLGGFVSAFGFGGALAQGLGAPAIVALPIGVVAGGVFGWFASWLTRLLRGSGSDDTPSTEDTLGRDATVITGIPADGFGTVRVQLGGHVLRLNARAERPLEAGTDVHVTGVLSPTAVTVAPVWNDLELP